MTFLAGLAGAIESLDHLIECPGKIESSDEPIDTEVEYADVFGDLQTQINAARVFDKILRMRGQLVENQSQIQQ